MGFIQRYIEKKKMEKIYEHSYAIPSLNLHIPHLVNAIKNAESSNGNISFKDYDRIKWYTQVVCRHYDRFICDLKEKELLYSCNLPEKEKQSLKKKIDYMHKLKERYKAEFSNIYSAYVDLIYNTDTMQLKDSNPIATDILGKMNEGFDRADINYNRKDDQLQPLITKK